MRDPGTSSAQTAGCGHTEIQQGLPVKQDYQLQRVAGDTQQGYRLQRITGYRETCYFHHYWQEGSYSEQVSEDSRSTSYRVLPLQNIASYREICCSHPYWQETNFKSSADNRFTGYRGFPVTEN